MLIILVLREKYLIFNLEVLRLSLIPYLTHAHTGTSRLTVKGSSVLSYIFFDMLDLLLFTIVIHVRD